MALAFSNISLLAPGRGTRGHRVILSEITYDGSYAAGGYSVTAANFGLRSIKKIIPIGVAATGAAGSGFLASWDKTNAKIKVYKTGSAVSTPFLEAGTNEATLNGLIGQTLVVGT